MAENEFRRLVLAETEVSRGYRLRRADKHRQSIPNYETNGDEIDYPNMIGQFHKGLPHDADGLVDLSVYAKFVKCVRDEPTVENLIDITQPNEIKLSDPLSAYTKLLYGDDPHYLASKIPPPPKIDSRLAAADLLCVYGMALLRDIPFEDQATDPTAIMIASELTNYPELEPYMVWPPTSANLFRDKAAGCDKGHHVSQFFLQDISSFGTAHPQTYRMYEVGQDKITTRSEFLDNINGIIAGSPLVFDPTPRRITTGRDGAVLVHVDQFTQLLIQTIYILGGNKYSPHPTNIPFTSDELSSCRPCISGAGIQTHADSHIVGELAMVASFVSKYVCHRRCRPEYMGFLVDENLRNGKSHPVHSILNSSNPILTEIHNRQGNYLLTQCYPEGSPSHPSYPAGHACVAWALCTLLKAYYDPDELMKIIVNPDGSTSANTQNLTIAGELHKMAANVSGFRSQAGVHFMTEASVQKKMCEALVYSILKDRIGSTVRPVNYTFKDDQLNDINVI